jgi:glutamate racemase
MIGVFDSGVGGLSVLREIRARLPRADLLYVADRGRAPYGIRTLAEVSTIAHEVTNWLMDAGATCVVIACNTASAAALHSIRDRHPDLSVVGMEPAVKPAAEGTASGTVAVYATAATFQGELFESVVSRFASGVEVIRKACPDWVELVERGVITGPEVERAVGPVVSESVDAGADRIVLGCTHFSFLAPMIERLSGVAVIDPAPAVAAQTARVVSETRSAGETILSASGDLGEFATLARQLADFNQPVIRFGK